MLSKIIFVISLAAFLGTIEAQTSCGSVTCRNGVCETINGVSKCKCKDGWIGIACNVSDPCDLRPCKNGTCYPILSTEAGPATYFCQCYSGYSGASCETSVSNVCKPNPCYNGGLCQEDKKFINGYYCICPTGYTGVNCGTHINPCTEHKCRNGAICIPDATNTNVTCNCLSGFQGFYCEIEIDECLSSPCRNNATCFDLVDGYFCSCKPGFAGGQCQTPIDPCASNPCKDRPNTSCIRDDEGSFICKCKEGTFGENCKPDPCKSNPCKSRECIPIDIDTLTCQANTGTGGIITITIPNYICKCPGGYGSLAC